MYVGIFIYRQNIRRQNIRAEWNLVLKTNETMSKLSSLSSLFQSFFSTPSLLIPSFSVSLGPFFHASQFVTNSYKLTDKASLNAPLITAKKLAVVTHGGRRRGGRTAYRQIPEKEVHLLASPPPSLGSGTGPQRERRSLTPSLLHTSQRKYAPGSEQVSCTTMEEARISSCNHSDESECSAVLSGDLRLEQRV